MINKQKLKYLKLKQKRDESIRIAFSSVSPPEIITEKELLKKSGLMTLFALFCITIFWFLFSIQSVFAYTGSGNPSDIKSNSFINSPVGLFPGTGTTGSASTSARFRWYYGTTSTTGTGSTGFFNPGSSTMTAGLPFIDFLFSNGSSTLDFVSFGSVKIDGVGIPSSGSVSGKLDAVGGIGTTNTFNNPTLAGIGTMSGTLALTGTISANSADISGAEISYLDNLGGNINTFQATHAHTGTDGTIQIAHNSVTGTGANSHAIIDNFIASKAAASGLASLDGSSKVVQDPANATSTPTASKIPISLGTGKLEDSWLSDNITKLGTPTTDSISEGSTNKYYSDARVNATIGSSSITSPQVSPKITLTSPAVGQFLKIVDTQGNVENGTSSVSTNFSAVTGSATSSQLPANPVFIGTLTADTVKADVIKLSATTTAITETSSSGIWYNLQSTVNGLDNYTKLLLHMNNPGTTIFVDSSFSDHTITANGDAIGTTTAKYGSGAVNLDGTGDYLALTNSLGDFDVGSGDFTLDCWFKIPNTTGNKTIFAPHTDIKGLGMFITNNTMAYFASSNGTSWNLLMGDGGGTDTGTIAITANVYHHFALTRKGNSWKGFIDGVQDIARTVAGTVTYLAEQKNIGRWGNGGYWFTGQIDEFRFSKGIARWNAPFTPPGDEYAIERSSLQYISSGTTTPSMIIINNGTMTPPAPTYGLFNITTVGMGYGTTTGLPSGYSLAVNGSSYLLGTTTIAVASNSRVGIGTTTPSAQLHTTGTLRHSNFGAGAATFDANGNISSASDERLKNIVGTFTAGLSELLGISPILYRYNQDSGLDMDNTYAGFSAQNVMQFIPEAIGKDSKGYYSFNDRPIVAALVNAIKELQEQIDSLKGKTLMPIKNHEIQPITNEDKIIKSGKWKTPAPTPKPVITPIIKGTSTTALP